MHNLKDSKPLEVFSAQLGVKVICGTSIIGKSGVFSDNKQLNSKSKAYTTR